MISPLTQARCHACCALRHAWRALVAFSHSRLAIAFLAGAAVLWLLAGCSTDSPAKRVLPQAPAKPASPLAAAGDRADAATANADGRADARDAKTGELLSKLKANVVSARAANQGNPDAAPRTKVEGELGVAEGRLTNVSPDPAELAAAAQRDLLVEQGRAAEARSAYDRATKDAQGQAAEVARAQQEAAGARLERDTARAQEKAALAGFQAELERNRAANQRALDDLRAAHQKELDDAHQQVLKDQVRWLNWAAAGCSALAVLSFGLAAAFGGLVALRAVAPFSAILGFSGLVAFGLAQVVGAWWFKWSVLGAVLVVLGVVIWWVLKKQKEGTLKADAEEKAARLTSALKTMVPVIDKVYDEGTTELTELSAKGMKTVRDLLDTLVFQPLGNKMDKDDKAVVHAIRAEASTPTPTK